MYKKLSAPQVVQIELSSLCPNNCQHCYNFWRNKGDNKGCSLEGSPNMSINQIEAIMDQLIEYRIFHIILTGGEPLLNKNVLFRAIEKAKENGITTSINSTLTTLNDRDCAKLKKLEVSIVMTSILGPNPGIHDQLVEKHGAFQQTVEGINLLQKFNVPVAINMVVTKKNKMYILETMHLAKELGLKSFNCTRAGCPGNCKDFNKYSLDVTEFRQYLKDLRSYGLEEGLNTDALSSYPFCGVKEIDEYKNLSKRRCMAGINTVAISATGDVRPCTHLDKDYGNMLAENLDEIWDRMTEWRDGSLIPSICKACKVLPWCGGGCRMEAKMRSGSLSELDPYSLPENSDTVYNLLKKRKVEEIEIPPKVKVNPKIRWRPESFGAAMFLGTRLACYLNNDGIKLFTELAEYKDLTREVFIEKCNIIGEGFAEGLVHKKVMMPSTN